MSAEVMGRTLDELRALLEMLETRQERLESDVRRELVDLGARVSALETRAARLTAAGGQLQADLDDLAQRLPHPR
jgi:chromosome segregation ATPase